MSKRILVIDDEPGIRGMVRDVLAGAGYEVFPEGRPDVALKRLATESFDLVVSDYCMPGMPGDVLFAEMRRQFAAAGGEGGGTGPGRSAPPVIVMTGYGDEERVRRWVAQPGVAGAIFKPFMIADLLTMVQKALAG